MIPTLLGVIGATEAFIITTIVLADLTGPAVEDQLSAGQYSLLTGPAVENQLSAGQYSVPPTRNQDQTAGNIKLP